MAVSKNFSFYRFSYMVACKFFGLRLLYSTGFLFSLLVFVFRNSSIKSFRKQCFRMQSMGWGLLDVGIMVSQWVRNLVLKKKFSDLSFSGGEGCVLSFCQHVCTVPRNLCVSSACACTSGTVSVSVV